MNEVNIKQTNEEIAEAGGQPAMASPETLKLFQEKSEFLLHETPFDFSEIFFRDFIAYVCERNDHSVQSKKRRFVGPYRWDVETIK